MENTAFRTFVYSFVFSLFMIFSINGLFFHTHPNKQDLKISNKNITLFLKNDITPSAKPQPVKKIALNILPDIPKNKNNSHDDSYDAVGEDTVIMADSSDVIPLEFDNDSALSLPEAATESASPVILAENSGLEPEVPAIYAPVQAQVLSISDGLEPQSAPSALPANRIIREDLPEPIKLATIYSPEKRSKQSESSEQNPSKTETTPAKQEITQPQLLIPLERSAARDFASNKKVKISRGNDEHQVALADAKVSTKNISAGKESQTLSDKNDAEEAQPAKWESMAEKTGRTDSPWVVATGAKHAKNKMVWDEQKKREQKATIQLEAIQKAGGKETVAANDMVDNILIPIPKDIKEKENLKPRLQFPEDAEVETKAEEAEARQKEEIKILDAQGKNIAKNKKQNSGGNLLSSITSIFSSSSDNDNEEDADSSITGKIRNKFSGKKTAGQILPAEIRLSFQPNRAEISGNTLRWIDAFAQKAIEDKSVVLEIRLDGTTDQYLQRRRLNLLSNVLNSKGVDARDVKVVFTEREPNSFIIRTLRTSEDSGYVPAENYNNPEAGVTQW